MLESSYSPILCNVLQLITGHMTLLQLGPSVGHTMLHSIAYLGRGHSYLKGQGYWSEILTRIPKKYQNPVSQAWLEIFFTRKRHQSDPSPKWRPKFQIRYNKLKLKTNTSTRKSTLTLVNLPSFRISGETSPEKIYVENCKIYRRLYDWGYITPSHTNVCKFYNFQHRFSQVMFHLKS